ncbi:MAG TPA: EAL domain-containing protein [Solirubrobacteraceae bacterium]|jgi:EAL domain-containing protein (putative c-di-GMP-specific phosphodiesterase class I)|nr:EAL domain-containing protein [Solirubrobacteraceae bacterium]
MPSSTTARASHRLLLRAAAPRAQRRFRGTADRPSHANGFSSPAGLHRRPWLARLRSALQNDLFVLHYQPIVSLLDGRVSHYEALVRLADEPHGRLVAPGSFLPAAERYGLVRDIDRLVLARAAAVLADGPDGGGPAIAINVSTLSATDGEMLRQIDRALARRAVDPSRLIVEVTETAAISDMRRARAFCEGVQALGCAVALDDFGSGFGSFQYLKHLPFDFLKIDGDFIRELALSPTDQLVVKALVDVVGGMGRRTIAEFVGDATTLGMLRDYGVDLAQGYEVGRPAPRMPVTA